MLRVLLAAFLISIAAEAQLPPTSETIDVNVVEVDVVVLDAQGKPVPGLERKDFDLRVGGRKRTITNFYAVNRRPEGQSAATTASNEVARRDYLVLFVNGTRHEVRGAPIRNVDAQIDRNRRRDRRAELDLGTFAHPITGFRQHRLHHLQQQHPWHDRLSREMSAQGRVIRSNTALSRQHRRHRV